MTTKREQILSYLEGALAGTAGVGGRIYRSRAEAFSRGECPAICIEPLMDPPDVNYSLPMLDWNLTVRVAVFVRGAIPDQLADPVVESLHARIMADPNLNGLAMDIIPAPVKWELIEADQPAGVTMCDYVVKYRTGLRDLSV